MKNKRKTIATKEERMKEKKKSPCFYTHLVSRASNHPSPLPHLCLLFTLVPLPTSHLALSLGVLSEEQIRLKKLKRQEEEQAQTTSVSPRVSSAPQVLPQLSPEQLGMIEKLVAAQQQCNRRSFSDRLRVTVLDDLGRGGWACSSS